MGNLVPAFEHTACDSALVGAEATLLGARTPEETAMSITAEIIAHANGASGLPRPHPPPRCRRDVARRKHLDRIIP
ncbi:hypothetical protein [Streptomyces sp. NBRC 110465]|uniref:hypothetical protein n=1 Tax=Streptomyces sp. NBRC 110465 TaxID=1897621 RepID=UPI0009331BCB|nr:hypothetical protein [Streptomyces sp. NBRC 110465]